MNPHIQILDKNQSRRSFLKTTAALSMARSAAPLAMSLASMGEAAALTAPSGDYKALVCVFLYGGNDYANTLIPYDQPSYNAYQGFRSNLAISKVFLDPTVLNPITPLPNGQQYALAPELAALMPRFNAGAMSVLLNIGSLVQPITKAQYVAGNANLPPKLFSHNDQQSYWQSSSPEGASSGWGGRMGDLFQASNAGGSAFTCIGLNGNAVYLSGYNTFQYQLTPTGAVPINAVNSTLFGSSSASAALKAVLNTPRTHLLETEYLNVTQRSMNAYSIVNQAFSKSSLTTSFPLANSLGDQLQAVARLISVRASLGVKRQVFFVSLGGFDNHTLLAKVHPGLMQTVGDAMSAFYQATVDLGVANQVTTFTASDFGRTLLSNSDGSDHGWGSMHFMLGGAVKGQSFVGKPPVLANNGPDDVGQGRLLPQLSVDQLAATLGNWFGVSAADQLSVLPNLKNFTTKDLGILNPT
jgi:uncharacterized protein (DUF1501 family)